MDWLDLRSKFETIRYFLSFSYNEISPSHLRKKLKQKKKKDKSLLMWYSFGHYFFFWMIGAFYFRFRAHALSLTFSIQHVHKLFLVIKILLSLLLLFEPMFYRELDFNSLAHIKLLWNTTKNQEDFSWTTLQIVLFQVGAITVGCKYN